MAFTDDVEDGGEDEGDVDDDEEESIDPEVDDDGGEDGRDGEADLQEVPWPGPGPAGGGGGRAAGSVGEAGEGVAPGPHRSPAVKHLETETTEGRSRCPKRKAKYLPIFPSHLHSPDCQQEEEPCGHQVCCRYEDQLLLLHREVGTDRIDTPARLNIFWRTPWSA